ncbi:hypothetical protein HHE03_05450 [Helicobacter heilmannii]|nr:hypothetical protein BN341_550 [Helicobacter heilmannii ASB1.4]CRF48951.1 hypothetical protein HHE03_05450 [Helicobacter heilmannii]
MATPPTSLLNTFITHGNTLAMGIVRGCCNLKEGCLLEG